MKFKKNIFRLKIKIKGVFNARSNKNKKFALCS